MDDRISDFLSYTFPAEIWVLIFKQLDPSTLFDLRRVNIFFCISVEQNCYKRINGSFQVNKIPWGMQIEDDHITFINGIYRQEIWNTGKLVHIEQDFLIHYILNNIISERKYNGFKRIFSEINNRDVLIWTYLVNDSYQSDRYFRVNERLAVISVRKGFIDVYSAVEGLLFSVSLSNEHRIVTLRQDIKLTERAKAKLEKEILNKIRFVDGVTTTGDLKSCLEKKPFISYFPYEDIDMDR